MLCISLVRSVERERERERELVEFLVFLYFFNVINFSLIAKDDVRAGTLCD